MENDCNLRYSDALGLPFYGEIVVGRIFEKRKYKMFARWAKNAKAFTKIGKEIAIAVKLGGPDPDANPRLRMAIKTASMHNMPKDRVENAIKKASSKEAEGLDEVNYEAYAPHGVALFVETATNNPTRTVANVRSAITKYGGNMATSGALDFVFTRRGSFKIAKPTGDLDEFELELIDHGLIEMFEAEDGDLLLYAEFDHFGDMQAFLDSKKIDVKSAGLERVPLSYVELSETQLQEVQKIIDLLEEDDDVQNVYHNIQM
jgi:YebC/PmpR family DNA-binding regulatory protein